jgi:hypothetical protein
MLEEVLIKKIMKKIIFSLVLMLLGVCNINAEVVRTGNTFTTTQTTTADTKTAYFWQDKEGNKYPIYKSKTGSLYVKRISKKTGKEYKYYLPKATQDQIKSQTGL